MFDINSKYKSCKLLLVGNFEDEIVPVSRTFRNQIIENKNIISVGFQSDIRPFLKMMNIFVFPSYREGFGQSLLEAAAMGIPAIASNIIGCNEIIKDQYNGILIPPRSTLHLKNAMLRVLQDPRLVNSMAANSRRYVLNKYEQTKLWKNTVECYVRISNNM